MYYQEFDQHTTIYLPNYQKEFVYQVSLGIGYYHYCLLGKNLRSVSAYDVKGEGVMQPSCNQCAYGT